MEDQPIPQENLPLYERADLMIQAEADAELAVHLETLRLTAENAATYPEDPTAQAIHAHMTHITENYLESQQAKPQNPQG